MSLETFTAALRAAMPNLVLTEGPEPVPPPPGFAAVSFRLAPVPGGVRLSVMLGEDASYGWVLSTEEEAIDFVRLVMNPNSQ